MAWRVEGIERVFPLVLALPERTWWSIELGPKLEIQANNREEVRRVRAAFPGAIWKKSVNDSLGWFEYHTTVAGIPVRIYADREGPAPCRREETVVKETRVVPACEEHEETVERRVVRWICPDREAVEAS